MRAGVAITDTTAGLYLTIGVLTALAEREVTGKGRWVRTSLLESCVALLDFQAARWLIDGVVPQQEGNQHPSGVPMGTFEAADGPINVAAAGSAMFTKFCKAVGREDWLTDGRFTTNDDRYNNREALRHEVAALLKSKTKAHWIALLNDAGLPCGPIYTIDQLFADSQVQHLQTTKKVMSPRLGELELLAQPVTLDGIDPIIRCPAPQLGEHNEEILKELFGAR